LAYGRTFFVSLASTITTIASALIIIPDERVALAAKWALVVAAALSAAATAAFQAGLIPEKRRK